MAEARKTSEKTRTPGQRFDDFQGHRRAFRFETYYLTAVHAESVGQVLYGRSESLQR
jgi:hypothetical protein